jgi:hypothetical protein
MNALDQSVQNVLNQLVYRLTGPFLESNVQAALDFFQRRMPSLSVETKLGFFRGIDLHKPVCVEWLPAGAIIAAFRRQGEPLFKLFYTKPGTSAYHLGVVPIGRRFFRFRVRASVEVLSSRAGSFIYAAAADSAGGPAWATPGGGGGIQYIVPDAMQSLEEILPPGTSQPARKRPSSLNQINRYGTPTGLPGTACR